MGWASQNSSEEPWDELGMLGGMGGLHRGLGWASQNMGIVGIGCLAWAGVGSSGWGLVVGNDDQFHEFPPDSPSQGLRFSPWPLKIL